MGKTRDEIEALVEELFVRNAVLEVMQAQLVLMLAGLTDDPQASVRLTMADVRTNIRQAQIRATEAGDVAQARIAAKALAYADDLTEQLVATKRYSGSKLTQ